VSIPCQFPAPESGPAGQFRGVTNPGVAGHRPGMDRTGYDFSLYIVEDAYRRGLGAARVVWEVRVAGFAARRAEPVVVGAVARVIQLHPRR
jgi:hypothetical protein